MKTKWILAIFLVLKALISNAAASSFSDLSLEDQQKVRDGEMLVVPVILQDDLLKGEVYQYVPSIDPEALTSVFFDYDEQYKFLPGMTSTRVLWWESGIPVARVRQRINPAGFILEEPLSFFQNRFWDAGAFTYDLNEALDYRDGSYTITWAEPPENKALNSEEMGKIQIEPFEKGSLISYQNGTRPVWYNELFKSSCPNLLTATIDNFFCRTSQEYYQKTVFFFIKEAEKAIANGTIKNKIRHLRAALSGDKLQ